MWLIFLAEWSLQNENWRHCGYESSEETVSMQTCYLLIIFYIYIHQNCRKSWYCSHMRQWHDVMTYCKKLLKLRLPCLLVFLLFLSLFNCMFTISLWTVILHVYQKEFPMLLRPLILCHFHVHYLLLRTIKKMCVFCALATNPNILVPPGKFLLGFLDKHR